MAKHSLSGYKTSKNYNLKAIDNCQSTIVHTYMYQLFTIFTATQCHIDKTVESFVCRIKSYSHILQIYNQCENKLSVAVYPKEKWEMDAENREQTYRTQDRITIGNY